MTKLRPVIAIVAMGALAGSQALAADDSSLAPGKPGGVRAAQYGSPSPLLIGAVALGVVAAVGIAVAASSDGKCGDACAVPSTST
jgi:hypothetical protein